MCVLFVVCMLVYVFVLFVLFFANTNFSLFIVILWGEGCCLVFLSVALLFVFSMFFQKRGVLVLNDI